jgi:ribosomal protein L11 methylase PrmA
MQNNFKECSSSKKVDPSSFRDPAGYVFTKDGKIFRAISNLNQASCIEFYQSPEYEALQSEGYLQKGNLLTGEALCDLNFGPEIIAVLEHEKLPLISYSYEWPFEMLRAAALFHLRLHIKLLNTGFTLKDASSYNIQFNGSLPIFIDTLSIRPYVNGEYWTAHDQFIRHFLNPLLLESYTGIHFQNLLRSSIEGIDSNELVKILPLKSRLNFRIWIHIFLPAIFDMEGSSKNLESKLPQKPFPKKAFLLMLKQLDYLIKNLPPLKRKNTNWSKYSSVNSYLEETENAKIKFVGTFIKRSKSSSVIDLGCNDGKYSRIALSLGAKTVFGIDMDRDALDRCFLEAVKNKENITTLIQDIANPSPSQGWLCKERPSLINRLSGDLVLALALVHHLAIGKNIPLNDIIQMIFLLAPRAIIEFIPKDDPMVTLMLSQKEDVFYGYGLNEFKAAIAECGGQILELERLPNSSRIMMAIEKTLPSHF